MPTRVYPQSTRWCFTINNPSEDEISSLRRLQVDGPNAPVRFLIFGREIGDSGTPHLQGFIIFNRRLRLTSVRLCVSQRGHFEIARGSDEQARDYCRKDGDFEEFGSFPNRPVGKENMFDQLVKWVREQETRPTKAELCEAFPSLMVRYRNNVLALVDDLYPKPALCSDQTPRPWQRDLESRLRLDPDDRSIIFVVDTEGNLGKSWFCRYYFSKYPEETQILSVGKRDDVAFAIDTQKRVLLFDIPRQQMEYFQYSVVESLKNRIVFSPKYMSTQKIMEHPCHVVVFCNEYPDLNAMTDDRYNTIDYTNYDV